MNPRFTIDAYLVWSLDALSAKHTRQAVTGKYRVQYAELKLANGPSQGGVLRHGNKEVLQQNPSLVLSEFMF